MVLFDLSQTKTTEQAHCQEKGTYQTSWQLNSQLSLKVDQQTLQRQQLLVE